MRGIWLTAMLALATPVFGQSADAGSGGGDKLRDLCPFRPGLDTPSCIVDQGHVMVELGIADWTLDKEGRDRTDTVFFGDTLLRYGIGPSTEVQFHWDGIGHVRYRDGATGMASIRTRAGDVSFGLKQNLINPDGDDLSIAISPTISVPVGRQPVGAGDWSGNVRAPVSYKLKNGITFEMTPEIDAAVDQDGSGRHLAYGSAGGVAYAVTKAVTVSLGGAAYRDNDPDGHATTALASLSAAWQPDKNLQFDAGAVAGLNHTSPDVELYMGVSRRF